MIISQRSCRNSGRGLQEAPHEIDNYLDQSNFTRFRKNAVVAIETFIATKSTYADTLADDWTIVGHNGGFMAQQEYTIVVTDGQPIILTAMKGIRN